MRTYEGRAKVNFATRYWDVGIGWGNRYKRTCYVLQFYLIADWKGEEGCKSFFCFPIPFYFPLYHLTYRASYNLIIIQSEIRISLNKLDPGIRAVGRLCRRIISANKWLSLTPTRLIYYEREEIRECFTIFTCQKRFPWYNSLTNTRVFTEYPLHPTISPLQPMPSVQVPL